MLNEIQQNFLREFKQNIEQCKNNFFILNGPAGSGKTRLIKESVEICLENGIDFEVLAFTGRAASLLKSEELENPKTIHRWISQLKKNKYFLELDNKKNQKEIFVIFIDESSMIPNSGIFYENKAPQLSFLLDEIMWVSNKHLPYKNIFYIFVGDNNQLPPVYENFSPALDIDFIKNRYGLVGKEFSLKNIYRQKNKSEIVSFAKSFKGISNKNNEIPKPKFNIEEINELEEDEVSTKFLKYFNTEKNSVKIITHDNKKSDKYNFDIKKALFDPWEMTDNYSNGIPNYVLKDRFLLPQEGDILQISKNDYRNELFNGQFIEVKKTGRVDYVGNLKERLNIPFLEIDEIPFLQQKIQVELINETNDEPIIKDINISLDYLLNNFYMSDNEFSFFESTNNGFLSEIKNEIRNEKMKNKMEILNHDLLNPVFCKYGFSITGHKAQGGGWDNIIIDFANFQTSRGDVSPSWIYTALTRTKNKTYFVNYPAYE